MKKEVWDKLKELRAIFLEGSPEEVYWESEEDVLLYDEFFAQRIGWKCDYVFNQLAQLGWKPPTTELLDWGCGSGIATRAYIEAFGDSTIEALTIWDHSPHAIQVAEKLIQPKLSSQKVFKKNTFHEKEGVLLISHVLTELDEREISSMIEKCKKAEVLIWIEPGTYDASHKLIDIRKSLLEDFSVIGPCTHRQACPMQEPQHETHWCHFFGTVPEEAFTSSDWAQFAKLMGIDLRALPLSYIVLDKRPFEQSGEETRMIGRARMYKPYVELLGCNKQGLHTCQLPKRHFSDYYKKFKKGKVSSLQKWEMSGNQIVKFEELPKE